MNQETVKLDIKVHPGSSRNEITGYRDGVVNIKVTTRPEKGKANAAVIDFLAGILGIAKSRITITRGTSSRLKTVEINGMDNRTVLDKLNATN